MLWRRLGDNKMLKLVMFVAVVVILIGGVAYGLNRLVGVIDIVGKV
jgi:hypothetical protein